MRYLNQQITLESVSSTVTILTSSEGVDSNLVQKVKVNGKEGVVRVFEVIGWVKVTYFKPMRSLVDIGRLTELTYVLESPSTPVHMVV